VIKAVQNAANKSAISEIAYQKAMAAKEKAEKAYSEAKAAKNALQVLTKGDQ